MAKNIILLVALLCLAGGVTFFLVNQHQKKKAEMRLVAELNEELDTLKEEAKNLRKKEASTKRKQGDVIALAKRQEFFNKELASIEARVMPLNNYLETIEDGIAHYQKEIEVWREAHRKSLVGSSFNLTKSDGTSLGKATVKGFQGESIVVNKDNQELTIPIDQLSLSLRSQLVDEQLIRESIVK